MNITAEQVKELRDLTGVSIMQCKKALEEANGDMEAAKVALRSIAAAQAEKKADRELGAGIIASYIHANKKMGVLVQISCETDFVSQNDEFVALANNVALHIGAMDPQTNEELLEQPFIMNPELTVKQLIDNTVQKTGERIEVQKFTKYNI